MIEADRAQAVSGERRRRRGALAQPLARTGQGGLVDPLLMAFHPRHVGIAEQRDAGRIEPDRERDHGLDAGDILVRQAVHQIEVDGRNAVAAKPAADPFDNLERLVTVDRRLDLGVEVLDADAGAVDAGRGQGGDIVLGRVARVDLDGELGAGGDIEGLTQGGDQGQPVGGTEHRRAAAAPVQVAGYEAAGQGRGRQPDLGFEGVEVKADRLVAIDDLGIAAAEPAHLIAKRDMEVERQRLRRIERAEPAAHDRLVHVSAKMRRRRIAGVAGNPEVVFLGETLAHR